MAAGWTVHCELQHPDANLYEWHLSTIDDSERLLANELWGIHRTNPVVSAPISRRLLRSGPALFDHVDYPATNALESRSYAYLSLIALLVGVLGYLANMLAYGWLPSGYFLVVPTVGVAVAYCGYRLGKLSTGHKITPPHPDQTSRNR